MAREKKDSLAINLLFFLLLLVAALFIGQKGLYELFSLFSSLAEEGEGCHEEEE